MSKASRRALWFDWRRREAELQLAVQAAEEFGTTEDADEVYEHLNEVYEELSILGWLWLNLWYEWRRSYIRTRNRRRAGSPI